MNLSKEEALKNRAQVSKNKTLKTLQDKLLLGAVIGIGALIILTSGIFHHKKEKVLESHEVVNDAPTLSQNMDYLEKMHQANATPIVLDGHHPPKLKVLNSGASKEMLARMNAPSTFFTAEREALDKGQKRSQATLVGSDANSQFLNAQQDITSVSAKKLPHPSFTVPAGEMIPATLETGINSELAGMARAIITRDIYSLEGNRLLISKGATIIGQFNAEVNQGQNRVFVVWNRIQMTNGIVVMLNSPSTDTIGRAGSASDYINRHFFERFGSGALLSVLGAYAATGGVKGQDEYNSMAQYRMNIASNFQQAANQALSHDMQVGPTLQINQGTPINVFVAHDLDFYTVSARKA